MKRVWWTISCYCLSWICSWAFAMDGLGSKTGGSVKLPIPGIHLVRVNDPVGLQGYDLSCAFGEEPKREPDCFVTTLSAKKTVTKSEIPFARAKQIAEGFLSKIPKKNLEKKSHMKKVDPPVRNVLIMWDVSLGETASNGYVKREGKERGVDPKTLRALLLLESELSLEE